MIRKSYIVLVIVIVALVLAFDALALTSVAKYAKYLSMLVSAVGFAVFGFYFRKFPKIIRQFGILFILLLIVSILSANLIHQQSYFSGIIASSSIFIVGSSFLIYYLLVRYSVSLETAKRSILTASWIFLFFFAFFYAIQMQFPSSSGDNIFGFQSLRKGIVNLGAIIYLTQFFKRNHFKYLVFSILLFSVNHWADYQRYILFVFIMCIGALLFNYRNRTVGLKVMAIIIFIVPALATILSTTEFGQEFTKKMNNVFELFEEDSENYSDSSIAIRVTQSAFAMESIVKYPLTGVGRIRSSEKDKVAGTNYFHVSDIGLIGILYSYGLFGLLIFFKQCQYLWKSFARGSLIREGINAEFKIFLLFLIVHTLLTGRSLNSPGEFMCILVLIEVGRKELQNQLNTDAA